VIIPIRILAAARIALLALFVVGAAHVASAEAVIATSLPAGPPGPTGTRFQVLVRVAENDTNQVPVACRLRVAYPSNRVALISAAEGDLGAPEIDPREGTPPAVYSDINTLGNVTSNNLVPDCFTLTFEVVSGLGGFFSITVADDPLGTPLLARDLISAIPHRFDNSATSNLGEPPPPKPSPSLVYTFAESDAAWRFVAAPPFTEPIADHLPAPDAVLQLTAQNNTDTFGYWESPAIDLSPSGSLFTAEYFVRSTTTDRKRTPQLRLRCTSDNLQQSQFATFESRSDGLASPGASGTTCTLVLLPRFGADLARIEFEMLNFDPSDETSGSLELERVRITRRDASILNTGQLIRTFSFEGGNEGWTPRATTLFSAPTPLTEPGRLVMTGNGRADTFGYWTSLDLPGGIPLPVGAASPAPDQVGESIRPLYVATFQVGSDVPVNDRSRVPQFRVRLNEAGGRTAATLAIESKGGAALSPVAGAAAPYVVCLLPPVSLAEKSLVASFDFLNFDPADLATASLRLEEMTLEVVPVTW